MQRDHWYTVARATRDLQDVEAVGRIAAERALARLDPRTVPTQRVPVLFSAEIAASLVGHLIGAISGGALYRRSSFLLDALGNTIMPAWLTIDERPLLRGGLASGAFDDDGVATRAKPFVERGQLVSYVLGTYSARKLGMQSTANAGGVHNLFVSHGDDDLPAMLRRMGRGLFVTEVMGQGVNMVTGDYSRGAAGFWVEGGELRHPVHEVTIAGNLKDMFREIVAVGADLDLRRSTVTGSILVDGMTVAGG
jgi:PmbA protein